MTERFELAKDYTISRVLNGCWQLSEGHSLQNSLDFSDVNKAFHMLVDSGFTTFDCADIYTGAEEFIGSFVKELKQSKNYSHDDIQIHTKYVPDINFLTCFPIFYAAGILLACNPATLAAAIVCGSIFGDNLAPISDTTIISAGTQEYTKKSGFADVGGCVASRLKYSLTAGPIAFILFWIFGGDGSLGEGAEEILAQNMNPKTLIMLIPVAIMLVTAILTKNIYKAITLVISVYGIMGVLTAAGALEKISNAILNSKLGQTTQGAEIAMMLGISITTLFFGGVTSASMATFGKIQNEIGKRVSLHPYRRANLLDGFANSLALTVPFLSVFVFIGATLTGGYEYAAPVSITQVSLHMFYCYILFLVLLISVLTGWGRVYEGNDGAPVKKN